MARHRRRVTAVLVLVGASVALALLLSNAAKDGSFRALRVELNAPPDKRKLAVRTRTGYFAQHITSGN